jgi:hypothetical protein
MDRFGIVLPVPTDAFEPTVDGFEATLQAVGGCVPGRLEPS